MRTNILFTKLNNVADLTSRERDALEDLVSAVQTFRHGSQIIEAGDRPDQVHLMLDGWAARRKELEDGAAQFTAFLIPGDFCDIHVTVLAKMDHDIVALSDCTVAMIDGEALDRLTSENSNLARALWWTTLVDEAVLREWIVNNGQRKSYAALAHILCELHFRLKLIGLAQEHAERIPFPLTQEHLANAMGISLVHVNRTLQQLRQDGLIELGNRMLTIRDVPRLRAAAGFETEYFHLQPRARSNEGIER